MGTYTVNATRKRKKVYYEVVLLTSAHVFSDCLKGFGHPIALIIASVIIHKLTHHFI